MTNPFLDHPILNTTCACARRRWRLGAKVWATLNSDTSRAFDKPRSGRTVVKVSKL
jgi:hypothetical protein